MKTTPLFLSTAALLAAMAFTFSCSGGDDEGDPQGNQPSSSSQPSNPSSSSSRIVDGEPIIKAKITGVFQKGPFVEGTAATLNELDRDLNPTGRPYQTLITDNKGTFELNNVELVSPYAHLIATGYFQNEVTGKKSNGTITLQAIVDVTDKDNINVNVLTHLEYYRVIDLVGGGMTVKAAKKQAQKEILAVFGIDSDGFKDSEDMTIFGASESDAALLAVSVLLLGDLGEADFTQRLMNFSQGIRSSGVWGNEEEKTKMVVWAGGANNASIKNNIVGWGLVSDVPDFGKYIFSYRVSGLETCNSSNEGEYKESHGFGYVCENNSWHLASYLEYFLSGTASCDCSDTEGHTMYGIDCDGKTRGLCGFEKEDEEICVGFICVNGFWEFSERYNAHD